MSRADHSRYEELVVGHALAALEPEDEQELLQHLPGCPVCQRDLAEHLETLGHLAHAVDAGPPPPQLWDAIRSEIAAESGRTAVPAPQPLVAPVPDGLRAVRERRERRRRTAGWASVAAALAVVASVSVGVATRDRDDQVVSSRLDRAVAELLEAGPGQTVPLAAKDGKAVAVAVVQDGRVSLMVDGMQPNDPSSSTYVLWAQSGAEQARALGTFDVDGALDVEHDMAVMAPGQAVPALFVITMESGRTAPAVAQGPAVATGRTL